MTEPYDGLNGTNIRPNQNLNSYYVIGHSGYSVILYERNWAVIRIYSHDLYNIGRFMAV